MRRTRKIVRELTRLARRPQSKSPRATRDVMSERERAADPLAGAPRITVSPAVVADLQTLRAADRAVVLTDGENELVAMVPVAQYRAQLAALANLEAADPGASTESVLERDELDALLADWDHSQEPRPLGPPTADRVRAIRLSDPPRRRVRRNR